MTKSNETNVYETYAIYNNVDESILQINPVIEPYGYKFIMIDLVTLEKKFAGLFLPNIELKSGDTVFYENVQATFSREFIDALQNHHIGMDLFIRAKVFLLTSNEIVEQKIEDGSFTTHSIMDAIGKMQRFTTALTNHLRLTSKGDIYSPFIFQSAINNRKLVSRLFTPPSYYSFQTFSLSENEIANLKKKFNPTFETNGLTELAISNFFLIYETRDWRTKFVILMICLECIFNHGAEQIAHTVSRHLALILSANKEEFELHYKQIKKLYSVRSKIVHGDIPKNKEESDILKLEDYVRFSINYCLNNNFTKESLFRHLNSKGY